MNQVRINPWILQAKQTSIVPSQLSGFCVTPIKSSVDKIVTTSRVFSFCKSVLASWQVLGPVGYGPSHHLYTLNSSSGQPIFIPTSNFIAYSNPSNCQLYCLSSFIWHQTKTWVLRHAMGLPLLHITNIIPPLYPIVLYLFILVGYPSYRGKNLYLWSPYSTSWNITILSAVKRPYRGILAISAWHFFNWETWNTSWTPDSPSGNSNL